MLLVFRAVSKPGGKPPSPSRSRLPRRKGTPGLASGAQPPEVLDQLTVIGVDRRPIAVTVVRDRSTAVLVRGAGIRRTKSRLLPAPASS